MKSKFLFSIWFMALASIAYAQPTITLLTFESYTFPDKFSTEYGNAKIEDGFQWGGGLEIGLEETMAIELIYQNLKTDAYYDAYSGSGTRERLIGNVGINYLMLGGTKYLPLNDVIAGFGSLDVGVSWFNPSSSLGSSSITKFALGGRLGVRFMASDKVSIRIHAQLLSPVQWAGGGFYFGTGGSGAGVSTGSTIYQFNLGGSLNFRLK
ncbi:MAG: hypothetical protein OEU76_00350 [Cyclobacteriaceae bacterium]|nr:hypothetical protein [Cyclobacteriaceae bacterium]